jgi:hypothetical protein
MFLLQNISQIKKLTVAESLSNQTRQNAESFPRQSLSNAEYVLPKPSLSKCRILIKTSTSTAEYYPNPESQTFPNQSHQFTEYFLNGYTHGLWVQFC